DLTALDPCKRVWPSAKPQAQTLTRRSSLDSARRPPTMDGASERQANDEGFFPSHSEFSLFRHVASVSHRDDGSVWCRERRCYARALINHYHDAITDATKSMKAITSE